MNCQTSTTDDERFASPFPDEDLDEQSAEESSNTKVHDYAPLSGNDYDGDDEDDDDVDDDGGDDDDDNDEINYY